MSQPSHSDATVASNGDANATSEHRTQPDRSERQDTLLLSDVPDASSLMPEASGAAHAAPSTSGGPTAGEKSSVPQFPSIDLTPLSQRYELLAEAGHGSMGNVYKARDRETGETVALKLLKPEIASDQTMMERFKKELLFARKITHKNVCRVHEFNRIGGIAYTSMEFVEGDSLRSVLNRFGGLPVRKALDLALQMCSALQEAHAQGIVHRDLKPENVMIDTQGNVKIMDFGIARSMDAMTRLTGSMVGTPAYMAPEQVSGKQVDFRTDIYALGLILYEMFTGQPAFQAENAVAVALKQMREAPKPPHEIDPAIPFGIERAIMKCLQKDPANRFQSIAQLADALRAPAAATSANAPGATSNAAMPTSHLSAATNRATNGTHFAPHPLYGASALSAAEPKRRSKSGWVLLLILIAGGAYAAMHWNQVVQAEHEYVPLTVSAAKYYYAQAKSLIQGSHAQNDSQPSAQTGVDSGNQSAAEDAAPPSPAASTSQPEPVLPETTPTEEPSSTATPVASPKAIVVPPPVKHESHEAPQAAVATKPSAHRSKGNSTKPSASPPAIAVPTSEAAATPAASTVSNPPVAQGTTAPPAVQQRADAASDEESTLSVPPVNDRSPRYLWIGRFETEDRAQITGKKVEELGLPVVVIPRRTGMGRFYLVLSGPFGPERVASVMEWLKEQGFPGVRVLKNPLRNGRLVPGVEQDPEN
jgi:serine/threonine protein kinase